MKTEIPSESYLLAQRRITFFDEWLFYLTLGILFFTKQYLMFTAVLAYGSWAIRKSYRRQWQLEEMRFGNADADNKD